MMKLSNNDSMYRLLVQSVTDYAIYMLSPDGTVNSWNPGAERFKGYTASEIVGQHFSNFYTEQDRTNELPRRALETSLAMGRFEGEGWRVRKDGSRFWANVVIDPVHDEEGKFIGFAKITRDLTEQREKSRLVLEQERNFRLLVQGVTDYAIYMLAPDGTVSNWNSGAERAKGYQAEEIVGSHFSKFYSLEDRKKGLPQRALATALAKGKFEGEGWRFRKNGTRFWAHVIIDPIYDDMKTLVGFAKITRDLTHSKAQLEEIQEIKSNLHLALANMSQGLCLFNGREQLVLSNIRFQEILGLGDDLVHPGSTFVDLLWSLHSRDEEDPDKIANLVKQGREAHLSLVASTSASVTAEQTWRGRTIAVNHRRLEEGGWVSTFEDVTEKKLIEDKITHLAHHDVLTELPNRSAFRDHVEHYFSRNIPCALLYLDLDRFKPINDTMGHPFGDKVLQTVAERIGLQLRKSDVGSRLGGDEFAVLLVDCSTELDASGVANRLIREISNPIEIDSVEVNVGVSVGMALSPRHGSDADTLFRNADLALYAAKEHGRGCYREYQEGMEKQLQERRDLERDLRHAMTREEFTLHYQPVVNINDNQVTSFEALLRWESTTRGKVAPLDFIPFAEEIGLMPEIGNWVLRTACLEASRWDNQICISVNLSPAQFTGSDLFENISEALAISGLAPERLELEITETAMIGDLAHARELLTALRLKGIQIALDDFGTGYSSLSFLRSLPFTRIKIDKSFIQDLGRNPGALAIIRAVTSLCDGLGVSATAEGVETEQQLTILRSEGCAEIQGYLINRPSTASDARAWLATYQGDGITEPKLVLVSSLAKD